MGSKLYKTILYELNNLSISCICLCLLFIWGLSFAANKQTTQTISVCCEAFHCVTQRSSADGRWLLKVLLGELRKVSTTECVLDGWKRWGRQICQNSKRLYRNQMSQFAKWVWRKTQVGGWKINKATLRHNLLRERTLGLMVSVGIISLHCTDNSWREAAWTLLYLLL